MPFIVTREGALIYLPSMYTPSNSFSSNVAIPRAYKHTIISNSFKTLYESSHSQVYFGNQNQNAFPVTIKDFPSSNKGMLLREVLRITCLPHCPAFQCLLVFQPEGTVPEASTQCCPAEAEAGFVTRDFVCGGHGMLTPARC